MITLLEFRQASCFPHYIKISADVNNIYTYIVRNWNLLILGKCYQQRNFPHIPVSHADYFPALYSHFIHKLLCLILFCFDYFIFLHYYFSLRQIQIFACIQTQQKPEIFTLLWKTIQTNINNHRNNINQKNHSKNNCRNLQSFFCLLLVFIS